jgi:hypothetical protein
MDFVAPVPMIGDRHSALALARFPGLRLPTGLLERLIAAPNPLATALDVVAELTDQIVASGRFIGVNLSGSASSTGPEERLEATAAFITAARAATGC